MTNVRIALLPLLLLFLAGCSSPDRVVTKKIPKEFVEFGNKRIDDYYWLSDAKDSAVIQHLKDENAHTEAALKHTEGLQKKIYDEMIARLEQQYESLPVRKNGYWYYVRYKEGQQYPVHFRKKGTREAPEEILLDLPILAEGHQIFIVEGESVSPNNVLFAYGIDTSGSRQPTMYICNLPAGTLAAETVSNTSGQYAWSADNTSVFYVLNDHTVRPYKVMRHRIGTDPLTDREVYTEADSTFAVSLSTSRDDKYIYISSGYTEDRETRIIAAAQPDAAPVVIQPRLKDLAYSVVDQEGDVLYIRTNRDARNFKLVKAPMRSPGMQHWIDVLPHRDDALFENARVFTRYIVAQERIKGLTQILVVARPTGQSYEVDFGEQAYVASMSAATDAADLDSIRYSYSSLTTPLTDYRYDLISRERTRLKQDKVGGGYQDSLYETRRIWARGADSVAVPISIVYKKSLFTHDGSNPMLLYAYGSYGFTQDPYFNRSVISLLDRGFVYGIAHIRGGQDLGRSWYEDGKMMKKKNTFQDFITCAEHLVAEKYTSPDRLFAHGGSAGGMLMGAITNMRPDLFRGVIADVPWMDVVTDMRNTDLPLTTLEYDEWGNPTIKEQYDYMMSWSPYDNVRDAAYPAILATGGLNDTNVPYYSPAKWVAKVRDHNTGRNPILFKVNMGAGHGGESGRFERQKLAALRYAFLLDLIGQKE
jgi:oligopeptidase B